MIRIALVALFLSGTYPLLSEAVEFESDILPIFKSRCVECHMDGKSKGGIAFDLDKIGRDIGSSKAIVPGDSAKSELIELVSLPDDDNDKMPPEGEGRPLSDGEIAKLKEWIDGGATVGDEEPAMEEEKPSSGLTARPDPIDGDWTNNQGKKIRATLVRVDGNNAVLRMNGRDFPYPIEDLAPESREIVRKFSEAWSKASGN